MRDWLDMAGDLQPVVIRTHVQEGRLAARDEVLISQSRQVDSVLNGNQGMEGCHRVNDRREGKLLVAKVLDVRITDVGAVEKEMVRSQPRPPIVAVAQSVLDIAQRGDLVL